MRKKYNSTNKCGTTVNGADDAPIAQVGAASGNEDTVIVGGLFASDIDNASLTFSLVTQAAHGAVAVNPNGTFSYTPEGNYNGPDSFQFKANDGSLDSNASSVNLTVVPVNDSPAGSAAGGSLLYLENQNATAIDAALTVSDPDSANFVSAQVVIAADLQPGQDVLGFVNQNGIVGSYDAVNGTLTLSGTSSVANYQSALRSVTYFNSSDNPAVAARTVDYQVNDGSGFVDLGAASVTVVAINDAPLITSGAGGDLATLFVAENTTAVSPVVATDPDSATIGYSIIGGSDSAQFSINASTGAFSFITAPDFEIPTDANRNNSYVVQVRASDGTLVDDQTITVSVTNVADPLPSVHWQASIDIGLHPGSSVSAGVDDFNGDATSDILWYNSTNGALDLWKISNSQWAGSVELGSHPAGWQPGGLGDFNHDGNEDILWYNPTTRDIDLWKMSNGQWAGSVDIGSHPAGSVLAGTGDFNGDGTSDILWYNSTTGAADIWKIVNGQWAGSISPGIHPGGYQVAGVGDFNGDGTSDIAWYNATTGNLDIWKIVDGNWAGSVNVGNHPAGYVVGGVGDFTKDGVSDILWYNPTNGDTEVWKMANANWSASFDLGSHPAGSQLIGVGDFDHNGVSDVLWRSTSTGHAESWLLGYS